ncbi:MAG: methyltransferase, partial [Microbacterium sp.]
MTLPTARRLAEDLAAARFRSEALRAMWGVEADDAIGRGLRAAALRAIRDRSDGLAVLARLLVFGQTQPVSDVDAALPGTGAAGLAELELAGIEDGMVVPRAVVRPQSFHDGRGPGEWIVASDLDELASPGPLPADHVLGVGGASLTLAGLQLPTLAVSVLDLGTGCGVQALRALRYADRVVATDVSARALRFAALNAELNAASRLELREGSLFDPVAGERFDRIVSNPPFVITPRAQGIPEYEYRDGGMVGDALVAEVVAAIGTHLNPGGVAQLLGNWESRDGIDGLDRVRAWVEASDIPLEAWVIERESLDPIAYAGMWIRDGGTVPGTPAHDALLDAWLDDFATRGVTAIGFGYLLLRRPAGAPTLSRYERLPQPLPSEGALGAHLAAVLAVHDRMAALTDAELLREHLRVAPDVTEQRHYLPGADESRERGVGLHRACEAAALT